MSVGPAPLPLRIFLSLIALIVAIICGAAARLLPWYLALLIAPIAIACAVAAVFIIAPYSRFSRWLDATVSQLLT